MNIRNQIATQVSRALGSNPASLRYFEQCRPIGTHEEEFRHVEFRQTAGKDQWKAVSGRLSRTYFAMVVGTLEQSL